MSIEPPETQIRAEQMTKELLQKQIEECHLQDVQKLQSRGFVNKDGKAFDQLVNRTVESIILRGTVIRVKLDLGVNLILAPECDGRMLYHTSGSTVPDKFHVKLDFSDDTLLTVPLTSMGAIKVLRDHELERSYVCTRNFSEVASTVNKRELTSEHSSRQSAETRVNITSSLVGKDVVIVGLSNSAFQDILFRAKIHPKRKASELSEDERHSLYDAIKLMINERIRLSGKDQFVDLYGNQGHYTPTMGPHMRGKVCIVCGTSVEKLSLGEGECTSATSARNNKESSLDLSNL